MTDLPLKLVNSLTNRIRLVYWLTSIHTCSRLGNSSICCKFQHAAIGLTGTDVQKDAQIIAECVQDLTGVFNAKWGEHLYLNVDHVSRNKTFTKHLFRLKKNIIFIYY